jgi:hypothetical protein
LLACYAVRQVQTYPFVVSFDSLAFFLTTSTRVLLRSLEEDIPFANTMYDICCMFFSVDIIRLTVCSLLRMQEIYLVLMGLTESVADEGDRVVHAVTTLCTTTSGLRLIVVGFTSTLGSRMG